MHGELKEIQVIKDEEPNEYALITYVDIFDAFRAQKLNGYRLLRYNATLAVSFVNPQAAETTVTQQGTHIEESKVDAPQSSMMKPQAVKNME